MTHDDALPALPHPTIGMANPTDHGRWDHYYTAEQMRAYARAALAKVRDKALRFDLDRAGIEQREALAVEVVELRAALAARAEPVAEIRECEACFTPDVCQLRGTCDYYSAARLRVSRDAAPLVPDAPPALPQDAARAEPDDVQREALRRLWPLIEKGTRGFAFTADKAGEVAADKNTLRQWIDAPVPGEGGGA